MQPNLTMEAPSHRPTSRIVGLVSLALLALTLAAKPARAEVTVDNVSEAIANAKTSADHEALAKYFEGKAAEAHKAVEAHKAMLKSYERFGTGKEQTLHMRHCKDTIRSYENLAKDYEAMAKEHDRMAKKATDMKM